MIRVHARGVVLAAMLAVLALALHVPAARADADPASDTLLVQDAFYPYTPSTPAPLQSALERALKEIRATGLNLKVAIIGSQIDLGGIPALFGQPDRYASFLDTEISGRGPQPLLVVMPDGVSAQNAGGAAPLKSVPIDSKHGSAGLVRTAIAAVVRIAAARGRPIAAFTVTSSGGGGGIPAPLFAAAAILLVVAAAAAAFRARAGTRRSDAVGSGF